MHTDLTRFFHSAWHLLTDVPGWADPPLRLRLRRLIPIIVPVVASILLFGWLTFLRQPEIDRVRTGYTHLVDLEGEIEQLRIACSDEQATELARQAKTAATFLLSSPEAAGDTLKTIRETAARHQWVGVFKDYQPGTGLQPEEDPILFVPAVGKMKPERGNSRPFASLLALLAEFSGSGLRIDLTRLSVRVDEANGSMAEVNFRIASHHSHEKAPQ